MRRVERLQRALRLSAPVALWSPIGFNIHPVLLGSGIPLFHEMNRQIDLDLLECRPFKNGCVFVRYRVRN